MKKFLSILCALLGAVQLDGVFYQVEIFTNPEGNICCLIKDEHEKADDQNFGEKQFQEFMELFAKYKENSVFCIEFIEFAPDEDVAKFVRENEVYIEQRIHDASKDIYLVPSLFLSLQKQKNLLVNVDTRHYSESFKLGEECARTFSDAFDATIGLMRGYNDPAGYKEYYQRVLDKYVFTPKNKAFLATCKKNPDALISQIKFDDVPDITNPEAREEALTHRFGVLEKHIVDARILHELYTHRDKEIIFVCAGGDHIDAILEDLKKLKYKHLKTIGISDTGEEVDNINSQAIFKTKELSDYLDSLFNKKKSNVNKKQKMEKSEMETPAIANSSSAAAAAAIAPVNIYHMPMGTNLSVPAAGIISYAAQKENNESQQPLMAPAPPIDFATMYLSGMRMNNSMLKMLNAARVRVAALEPSNAFQSAAAYASASASENPTHKRKR